MASRRVGWNELFSAIDGEYEYDVNDGERINYDLSPQDGISSPEAKPVSRNRTEFHFSLDATEVTNMSETFEQTPNLWVPGQ